MLAKTVGEIIGAFVKRISSKSPLRNNLVSTQFVDTSPATVNANDTLRTCGRMVCRVMTQVVRRAGFDASLFQMTVEFNDQKAMTFRVLADMPTTSLLSHRQCKEIENTLKIELEMRYEMLVGTVYWRIKDADSKSKQFTGLQSKPQEDANLGARVNSRLKAGGKKGYPAPVRVMSSDDEGLHVTHDREATPSEIEEFHRLLAQASTPTDK